MKSPSKTAIPLPVKRALIKLGGDLRIARLRRRISTEIMSKRAFISRMTLNRAEKGDPRVSMAVYATILYILGMTDRLSELADFKQDTVGIALEEEILPKRIRVNRKIKKNDKGREI